MLRDVFYYGHKPNVHPREKSAKNLEDARYQSTTEHFWIVNEYCDYTNFDWDFDFDFLPNEQVWHETCNNAWPSLIQKDSGTWLCPKQYTDNIVYRTDVQPLKRHEDTSHWVFLDKVDKTKFDFSWHPDPTSPPFIYKWGCKWYESQIKHVLEYHVPGATQERWMDEVVELEPDYENLVITQAVDSEKWDLSWRPDPRDPPYIYVWGNKYIDGTLKSTIEYHTPNATEYKYMPELIDVLPEYDRWEAAHIDKTTFDFTWRPDPREPAYIYEFPTQHQENGGPRYIVPGATEVKYINIQKSKRLPNKNNWEIPNNVNTDNFDFSWHPDSVSPPYIYEFSTVWNDRGGPVYTVPGAIEKKYIDNVKATLKINKTNWEIPSHIDTTDFDFSWVPHPEAPPYIYEFGTQHQKTGGPQYIVEGATDIKYVDVQRAKKLPNRKLFEFFEDIEVADFDYSWHPDSTDESYIYVFGNTQYPAEIMPTVKYTVEGATQIKYVKHITATLKQTRKNWIVPKNIDSTTFDFSWVPNPKDPPYIYQFGTQWQETGGPKYVVAGATEVKYVDNVIGHLLSERDNWEILIPIIENEFDFTWHPHPDDPPYIYVFGNNQYKAEEMHTVRYVVEGATKYKYMTNPVAKLAADMTHWIVPENIDATGFDFSWKPNPSDPPYIYEFGTQHQKTGGPVYTVAGGTELKFVSFQKVKKLPNIANWQVPDEIDITNFDFSWHPDDTEPPYIYQFGTQHQKTGGPVYIVPGATETKYIKQIKTKQSFTKGTAKVSRKNWHIPKNIDDSNFDFSWHPDDTEPPYIYEFGTQWQETGGPRYIVEGATEIKYIGIQKSIAISYKKHWTIPEDIDVNNFDFSWHPDNREEPYIYEFGTQHQKTGGPRYVVPNAVKTKFIDLQRAKKLPNKSSWIIPNNIDDSNFDYSWHPDETEPAYKYEFNTQWQKNGGPIYVVKGATQTKYLYCDTATAIPTKQNWEIPSTVKVKYFDYSWHPDNTDDPYIYVFGNNLYPAENMVTVKYVIPGATNIKFLNNPIATLDTNYNNWTIPENIDRNSFDFSWVPDPTHPPYIYEFATIWNNRGGPQYKVPGSFSKKYVENIKAKTLTNKKPWKINIPIVDDGTIFTWTPHPEAPPYIYVFGNKWNNAEKESTLEYHVQGAVKRHYVHDILITVKPNKDNFTVLHPIVETSFDYSWRPDPDSPPYIYIFGNNQYPGEIMPTVKYTVDGASEEKFVSDIVAKLDVDMTHWTKLNNIDCEHFDFSWVPNPKDPPYIYEFGTQHQKTGGPIYSVPGATQVKFIDTQKATKLVDLSHWQVPNDVDTTNFDFSWHPDDTEPPYIYQFGTLADDNDGPRYIHPLNTGEVVRLLRIESKTKRSSEITRSSLLLDKELPKYYITTTLDDLVKQHPSEVFWALNKNINYDNFNFSWRPNIEQARYVHVFGSPESKLTHTYFVSGKMYSEGSKKFNFVETNIKVDSEYLSELFNPSDMFYIDRGNKESQKRYEELKKLYPNIIKTRYLNNWAETIYRCTKRCTTQLAWILNSELDYTKFNFKYYPNPWQMQMIHIFGTQWSHWGTTYMINKDTFFDDTYELGVKVIEHLANLNFVKDRTAKAVSCLYDVYLIDHGNMTDEIKNQLEIKTQKNIITIPYKESYLKTFKNLLQDLETKKEHYIWICSSVCDYSNFDFSFICDPFAKENLHVFSSNNQKFGDTFLIDVNKLRSLVTDLKNLEDYQKVTYNEHLKVPRFNPPVFVTTEDTHYNAYTKEYNFPYALFYTKDNENLTCNYNEPMSLWASHTKNIEVLSTGGSVLAIPKQIQDHIGEQLYDYPHISKSKNIVKSNPLDIIYLSNGEKFADKNYEYLLKVTKGLQNRIVRVDGINGRVKAYHAAAEASNTPWMFTIFAKLKIDKYFDWSWQPDRLQSPKHYIFHAKNPVNELIYGHQAMIAYNKKLALENNGKGLDFTLDDPHSVINILSGVAEFNTDAYSTWRTAFREVIKLQSDTSDISYDRLQVWLNKANGMFAEDCLRGANDAVEYYKQVGGDITKLKYSYEWSWLKEYYDRKYK